MEQIYQPLQAAPVKDLSRWYQAERAPLHERCETDELLTEDRPVALLGVLGGGKTTTLPYLAGSVPRKTIENLATSRRLDEQRLLERYVVSAIVLDVASEGRAIPPSMGWKRKRY